MPRWSLALLPLATLALAPAAASPGARAPRFVHVQTDRPAYRIGEAIWFRVHAADAGPLEVRLLDPGGTEIDRWTGSPEGDDVPGGAFVIPRHLPGGVFRLEARIDDAPAHAAPLEVVDLALPRARLELAVLGGLHLPGEAVTASFRASDLRGRPIRGAAVEYRATFGRTAIRDAAGRTDADGRALIRFTLPRAIEGSGHLAAGITIPGGEAAIARRIEVAPAVASIDAFAEGGSILEGWPQRVALLARDDDGEPTGAEGRIVDDTGATAAAFKTDAAGLATAVVPYEEGRTYHAVVDRPAGAGGGFPLPAPSGHDHAIAVEDAGEAFDVVVASRREAVTGQLDLVLEAAGVTLARNRVRPERRESGAIRTAHVRVPRTDVQGIGHLVLIEGARAILKRPVFLGARAPVTVSLEPISKGPHLPGRTIELELRARQGGRPVSADLAVSIFQGSAVGVEDIAARLLLEPSLPSGARVPTAVLEDARRRDTYLLVHDAYSYDTGGASLESSGLPAAAAGRVTPANVAPRAPAPPGPAAPRRRPATSVRSQALERALEAAPYTVLLEREEKAHDDDLLDEIEGAAEFFDGKGGGEGFLGSRGDFLASEVLALAVIALDAAGRQSAAELLAADLRRRKRGFLGTQGGALATRALARVNPVAAAPPFRAQFDPGGAAGRQTQAVALRSEPLVFEETVPLGPGDGGRVALDIRSEAPCAYRLAYAYRTQVLRSSPEAPFALGTSMPGAVDLNGDLPLTVVIVPRRPAPPSQVVARIGLPGGIEIPGERMGAIVESARVAHWEVRDGFLDLYWARPPRERIRLVIPTRAIASGSFKGRPSVIAPYYEAGREHYAPSLALRVHNPFGIESPFDGPARPRRR